jgi:hypothetical protein
MTPRIRPEIMDSHGKPGIAGSTIGVVTELVDELIVVVGVLETVTVDTDVLTIAVVGELIVEAATVVTLEAALVVLVVLTGDTVLVA